MTLYLLLGNYYLAHHTTHNCCGRCDAATCVCQLKWPEVTKLCWPKIDTLLPAWLENNGIYANIFNKATRIDTTCVAQFSQWVSPYCYIAPWENCLDLWNHISVDYQSQISSIGLLSVITRTYQVQCPKEHNKFHFRWCSGWMISIDAYAHVFCASLPMPNSAFMLVIGNISEFRIVLLRPIRIWIIHVLMV